jgi:hypothetical protein
MIFCLYSISYIFFTVLRLLQEYKLFKRQNALFSVNNICTWTFAFVDLRISRILFWTKVQMYSAQVNVTRSSHKYTVIFFSFEFLMENRQFTKCFYCLTDWVPFNDNSLKEILKGPKHDQIECGFFYINQTSMGR